MGLSRSGWGWDTRLADFDNDGVLEALQATGFVRGVHNRWPELHEIAMGNDELLRHPLMWHRFRPGDDLSGHEHNPFFVRAASGRFVDLAAAIGIDRVQVTRGVAIADVDGDGDLDFAAGNQWDASRFYENRRPASGFLGLRLLLAAEPGGMPGMPGASGGEPTRIVAGRRAAGLPVRPAIGAEARVTLPGGRVLVAQVDGGNGHSGARSPELHFGLGTAHDAGVPLGVELRWRDRHGRPHATTLELAPGWHTVVLGESIATAQR
jgi:hypothetical protein